MERYSRNEQAISPEDNAALKTRSIAIVGLGGLGGYVAESFARLGVAHMTLIDRDVFEVTNLNRQLNSYPDNLGTSKVEAARERVHRVNPGITLTIRHAELGAENAVELLGGHDIVMDCLDSIPARLLLEAACEELAIPLIHGAVSGWYGQVSVVMPGDRTLSEIYQNQPTGLANPWGNPIFIVTTVASLEVAEAVKVLLHQDHILTRKLLLVDLATPEFIVLDLPPQSRTDDPGNKER